MIDRRRELGQMRRRPPPSSDPPTAHVRTPAASGHPGTGMAIIAMTTANVAVRPGRARVALGAASCENVLIVLRHRQPLVQANTRGRARREIVQSECTGSHLAAASRRSTLRAGRNGFLHPHPGRGSPNLLTAPPSAPTGCWRNTPNHSRSPHHLRRTALRCEKLIFHRSRHQSSSLRLHAERGSCRLHPDVVDSPVKWSCHSVLRT
jgi:hypothetical protein